MDQSKEINENKFSSYDQNLLKKYYRQRRIKIIFAVFILLLITALLTFLAYSYHNNLYMFSDRLYLKIDNSNPIIVRLSEINDFNPRDYIISYYKEDTVMMIPDKDEISETPGIYKLEYSLTSKKTKKNVKEYLSIVVKDDIEPVLELSERNVEIEQDTKIELKNYIRKAADNVDGDLKSKTEISLLDSSKPGIQKVIFTVRDSSGNKTEDYIEFNIKEKKKEPETQKNTADGSSSNENKTNNSTSKTNSDNKKSSGSKSTTASKLNGKEFLFKDGYNMSNVMSVCSSTLSKAGVSGKCVPIYDSNGIILGAKIVIK